MAEPDDNALLEVKFTFCGHEYRMRPTFKKLVQIEAALNQPSRNIGMRMYAFEAGVSEIAAVLSVMLLDEPSAPKAEEIGPLLVEEGYADLMGPMGNYLTRAQRGNKEHIRQAKAAAELEAKNKREGTPAGPMLGSTATEG